MIHVEDKELVVPGQILAEEGFYSGRGTFKDGKSVCSSLMGLVSLRNKKISVIPLKSKYVPKRGDVVIGKIDDVRFSMWGVNVNSPYSGILPASEVFGREKRELKKVFDVGDVLFLRVVDVDEVKKVKLGLKGRGMGKFRGGVIVDITPTKVPRLIGKKGSMINMIKDKTRCKIVVGQNGLVWVKGDKGMEQITKTIINLIEAEAHTSGLTDRIRDKLYLLVDGKIPKKDDEFEITADDIAEITNKNASSPDSSFKDSSEVIEEDVLAKPKLENIKEEIESEEAEDNLSLNKDDNDLTIDNSENTVVDTVDGDSDDSTKEDAENLESAEDAENVKDANADSSSEESGPPKISYLDTFSHIINKSNTKKPGIGNLREVDHDSSPTLNVSNSPSIEKKDFKYDKKKPVTTWKRKE